MTHAIDRRRFLEMAMCGALAACGNGDTAREPPPPPQSQIDRALEELPGLAADLMQRTGLPGMAVAAVRGGQKAFARGFGTRSAGADAPVDADTAFQLASMSKPIGATVVAKQVGVGSVQWRTRLRTLLPWFALADAKASDAVTIGDMYSHRSGLPEHVGDRLEDMGYDRRAVLERLRYAPIAGFRDVYAYTNFGLTAGAEAVSAAAGVDWATLSDLTLYQPLGMTRTTSRYKVFHDMPNHASGHVKTDGAWVLSSRPRDADAQSPAGGVSSSVNDVAKWMLMMLGRGVYQGKRIVDETALAACVRPQIRSRAGADGRPDEYYGYGFNVGKSINSGRTTWGHSGAFALGAATSFRIMPSVDVGIVALTNGFPQGIAESLVQSFFDIVETGAVQRDWYALFLPMFQQMLAPEGSLVGVPPPAHPAPPSRALALYKGSYANTYHGPATIGVENGALQLKIGPAPISVALAHWDGDAFAFRMHDENAPPGTISKATFDGDRMVLEYYDRYGLGSFLRTTS